MLESDDIHLCRCNANSDNRKVSIIYCVSRNIIPNIGRDKSLVDDLNMWRGIVSRGVVFALRPAEIRPLSQRFVRMDISPPTQQHTTHLQQHTQAQQLVPHTHPRPHFYCQRRTSGLPSGCPRRSRPSGYTRRFSAPSRQQLMHDVISSAPAPSPSLLAANYMRPRDAAKDATTCT